MPSYVWTFAGPEAALYVYAPTWDGDVLRETLAGFRGVLESDFYSAYDTVDCPRQKCVVHLLRDLNDDLAAHPFDGELKDLAARFGGADAVDHRDDRPVRPEASSSRPAQAGRGPALRRRRGRGLRVRDGEAPTAAGC